MPKPITETNDEIKKAICDRFDLIRSSQEDLITSLLKENSIQPVFGLSLNDGFFTTKLHDLIFLSLELRIIDSAAIKPKGPLKNRTAIYIELKFLSKTDISSRSAYVIYIDSHKNSDEKYVYGFNFNSFSYYGTSQKIKQLLQLIEENFKNIVQPFS